MIAIFGDYPDNGPEQGVYIGTAQYDIDYTECIFFSVYNVNNDKTYKGVLNSSSVVKWIDPPFSGFQNIMRDAVQYIETLNNYDFTVYLNRAYNFASNLEGKKLYIDMELVSSTPNHYTSGPLPVEMVTVQNHWIADNVPVYSAALNAPANGKITILLGMISNPNSVSYLNFTVIGSGLSGALRINGIYVK